MMRREEPWPPPTPYVPPPHTPKADALAAAREEQERARRERPIHVPLADARPRGNSAIIKTWPTTS